MIPARLERMRDLRAFLEGFCAAAGVPRDPSLRLNLVIEELFTNTVRHGHGGDSDAPVWVSLARADKSLRLTYEDTGPPFNPYAYRLPFRPNDSQRLGGLGVLLTRGLSESHDYAYVFGRNLIRLELAV